MQRVIISSFQITLVSKIFLSGVWKGTALIFNPYNVNHNKLHRTLLNFREIIDLDISYEPSTSRQFTWNVFPYLVSIKRQQKNFKSVVCLIIRSALLSSKKCVITATLHNLSTQTQERIYWIHDTFLCWGIKLCTKLHNTEPDIFDIWHAKSIYFRSTDTLCIQWPFPLHKVGVAFLIYESNQDRPCDFVMSCWQLLCLGSWIGLSMVVFQRQYPVHRGI